MKFFFITTNYTVYLSFFLLTAVVPTLAQSPDVTATQEVTAALQITQTAIELNHKQVAITWMTQGENDLDLFVVQRSLDGKQWEQLVAIAATNNTTQQQIYQTTDSQPYEGTTYYRVGQLDYDGQERYAPAAEINYEVPMERFFSAHYLKKND